MNRTKSYIALATLFIASCLQAQSTSAPAAPVPSQFATAHTAFLASGGNAGFDADTNYTALVYASTYQMLQNIHHYQLTSTPAEADLSMEISVLPNSGTATILRLAVYDTKTHALLWNIDSMLYSVARTKDEPAVINAAESRISAQLQALIIGTVPLAPVKK